MEFKSTWESSDGVVDGVIAGTEGGGGNNEKSE